MHQNSGIVVGVVGHFERDNLLIACIPWDRKVFSQLCEFSGEEELVRAKVQTLSDSVRQQHYYILGSPRNLTSLTNVIIEIL